MCHVVKIWVSDAWIYSSNPLVISVMPNCSGLIGIFSMTSGEVKEKGHLHYKHTLKYCDIKQGKRIFFGNLNSRFHCPWCLRYFLCSTSILQPMSRLLEKNHETAWTWVPLTIDFCLTWAFGSIQNFCWVFLVLTFYSPKSKPFPSPWEEHLIVTRWPTQPPQWKWGHPWLTSILTLCIL